MPIAEEIPTLTETLRDNGYFNGIIGKLKHAVPMDKFAWDYASRMMEPESNYGRSPELYRSRSKEFFEKAMAQAQDMEKIMAEIEENNKMYDNALKALLDKKQFRAYQKEKRRKEIEERRRFESMFMGGPGGFGGFGGGFGGPGGGFGGPGGF